MSKQIQTKARTGCSKARLAQETKTGAKQRWEKQSAPVAHQTQPGAKQSGAMTQPSQKLQGNTVQDQSVAQHEQDENFNKRCGQLYNTNYNQQHRNTHPNIQPAQRLMKGSFSAHYGSQNSASNNRPNQRNRGHFRGTCDNCNKPGHIAKYCPQNTYHLKS